jgi:hypothetical protein
MLRLRSYGKAEFLSSMFSIISKDDIEVNVERVWR